MPRVLVKSPSFFQCPEAEHSNLSSDCPAVSNATEIELPLMERRPRMPKSTWLSDTTDLFVLLCYSGFIATSIVLFALVLHSAITHIGASGSLSILQRVLATFSVSVTTAVMIKRYVLFKLTREGLRSRRVAIYSNPSIGDLTSHLLFHGMELPLLGLLVVWGLALAAGLTANDIWEYGPFSSWIPPPNLSGLLNPRIAGSSYVLVLSAAAQLATVMTSICRKEDFNSLIHVTASPEIYYPAPPPLNDPMTSFSYSTTVNGFNISMEPLSSIPSTAQNLTCTKNSRSILSLIQLWSAGSDNETLSIIIVDSSENPSIFRFNATSLVVGGTMFSTGSNTEYVLNGTSWPNVMTTGNQWAQDITTIICNATCPSDCGESQSLFDFVSSLNGILTVGSGLYPVVRSALNMALGAYSSAMLLHFPGIGEDIPITIHNSTSTTQYGIYILAVNIIVSVITLIIALRLYLVSPLGSDFINSTWLLLDPLKKPELFNASLDRTVEALADPYVLVRNNKFLLAEGKLAKHRRGWRHSFGHEQEEHELSIRSED